MDKPLLGRVIGAGAIGATTTALTFIALALFRVSPEICLLTSVAIGLAVGAILLILVRRGQLL